MSHLGQQLLAPNGWHGLVRGRRYHYLGDFGDRGDVRFVWFSDGPPKGHLEVLKRSLLEEGIDQERLVPAVHQTSFPPWLERYDRENVVIEAIEEWHVPSRKERRLRSNEEEADARVAAVGPLIDRARELLRASDMVQQINRFARTASPKTNESRTRLWFLLFVVFKGGKWALLPDRSHCGRKTVEVGGPGDFGRDCPARGRYARAQCTAQMRDRIVDYWKQFTKGKKDNGGNLTFEGVKGRIISDGFGCHSRTVDGHDEFFHPMGESFPTLHQVEYTLIKRIGRPQVQVVLYGAARVRNRLRGSKGNYSEYVATLLEQVEADAYSVSEVPRGPDDGNPMKPLWVVRIRCVVSGMLVGVGFSIGAETSEAYAMALFSMALQKREFCRLFGLDIDPSNWPCQGLPSLLKLDRGPGSRENLIREFADKIPIRSLAPSYSGQSKATVESAHPRTRKKEGSPEYLLSDKSYVELAKREILRLIADNSRIDAARRLTPNMLRNRVFPTPLCVWNYLDARCRTSAHPMALERAVTTFLKPISFTVDGEGAHFEGALYRSDALTATAICDRAEVHGNKKVQGYAPAICLRGAWLEIKARLVWVDMCLRIADDESQLYLSVPELEALNRIRKGHRSLMPEHRQAVSAEMRRRYKHETGKDFDGGTVKRGRAHRNTAEAQAEYQIAKKAVRG